MEFLPLTFNGKPIYAGFWKRLSAALIDGFLLLGITQLLWNFEKNNPEATNCVIFLIALIFPIYSVYFNARFGGTLGKLAVGIRITKPDGISIGWKEAWKRSSVDLLFAILAICQQFWALAHFTGNSDLVLPAHQRAEFLQSHKTFWTSLINNLSDVWMRSEVIIMLTNKRRRALHDFIAGTVVVHKKIADQITKPNGFSEITPEIQVTQHSSG